MKIRNINPLGAVELDGVGIVDAGAVIDVPADGPPGTAFAGRPPEPRLAAAMAELAEAIAAIDHDRAKALREEITGWTDPDGTEHPGLDFGAGLLAQVENWEPATSKPARKADQAGEGEGAQP